MSWRESGCSSIDHWSTGPYSQGEGFRAQNKVSEILKSNSDLFGILHMWRFIFLTFKDCWVRLIHRETEEIENYYPGFRIGVERETQGMWKAAKWSWSCPKWHPGGDWLPVDGSSSAQERNQGDFGGECRAEEPGQVKGRKGQEFGGKMCQRRQGQDFLVV